MNSVVKIEEGYREKPPEVKKISGAPPDAKSDGYSWRRGVLRERRSRLESKIVLPELVLRIAYTIRERENEGPQKKDKKTQQKVTGRPVRADPQSVREGMNSVVKIKEGYREKPSEVKKVARALNDTKSDGYSSRRDVFREPRCANNVRNGQRAQRTTCARDNVRKG